MHAGRQWPGAWTWLAVALTLPALVPLVATLAALLRPDPATLAHLWQYVLPQVAGNTFWLLLGVGAGTAVLGTALAALVALCEFPGRRVFAWLLVLPLALPGYVLAVAFIGLFDYSAPLAGWLRDSVGWELPDIRARGGLVAVMTLEGAIIVDHQEEHRLDRIGMPPTGGMGMGNAEELTSQNIVALCDVDFGYVERQIQTKLTELRDFSADHRKFRALLGGSRRDAPRRCSSCCRCDATAQSRR